MNKLHVKFTNEDQAAIAICLNQHIIDHKAIVENSGMDKECWAGSQHEEVDLCRLIIFITSLYIPKFNSQQRYALQSLCKGKVNSVLWAKIECL